MSDDKALTARDGRGVIVLAYSECLSAKHGPFTAADSIVAALDAAGFEITAKGEVEAAIAERDSAWVLRDGAIKQWDDEHRRFLAEMDEMAELIRAATAERDAALSALAEAQQRIEAVKALHARLGNVGVPLCTHDADTYPCATVRALSASTAPETETTEHGPVNDLDGGYLCACGADRPCVASAHPETETT